MCVINIISGLVYAILMSSSHLVVCSDKDACIQIIKPRCENVAHRNFFVERVVNVWDFLTSIL